MTRWQKALKAAPILGLRGWIIALVKLQRQAKTLTRVWRSRYIGRSCAAVNRRQGTQPRDWRWDRKILIGAMACLFGLALMALDASGGTC